MEERDDTRQTQSSSTEPDFSLSDDIASTTQSSFGDASSFKSSLKDEEYAASQRFADLLWPVGGSPSNNTDTGRQTQQIRPQDGSTKLARTSYADYEQQVIDKLLDPSNIGKIGKTDKIVAGAMKIGPNRVDDVASIRKEPVGSIVEIDKTPNTPVVPKIIPEVVAEKAKPGTTTTTSFAQMADAVTTVAQTTVKKPVADGDPAIPSAARVVKETGLPPQTTGIEPNIIEAKKQSFVRNAAGGETGTAEVYKAPKTDLPQGVIRTTLEDRPATLPNATPTDSKYRTDGLPSGNVTKSAWVNTSDNVRELSHTVAKDVDRPALVQSVKQNPIDASPAVKPYIDAISDVRLPAPEPITRPGYTPQISYGRPFTPADDGQVSTGIANGATGFKPDSTRDHRIARADAAIVKPEYGTKPDTGALKDPGAGRLVDQPAGNGRYEPNIYKPDPVLGRPSPIVDAAADKIYADKIYAKKLYDTMGTGSGDLAGGTKKAPVPSVSDYSAPGQTPRPASTAIDYTGQAGIKLPGKVAGAEVAPIVSSPSINAEALAVKTGIHAGDFSGGKLKTYDASSSTLPPAIQDYKSPKFQTFGSAVDGKKSLATSDFGVSTKSLTSMQQPPTAFDGGVNRQPNVVFPKPYEAAPPAYKDPILNPAGAVRDVGPTLTARTSLDLTGRSESGKFTPADLKILPGSSNDFGPKVDKLINAGDWQQPSRSDSMTGKPHLAANLMQNENTRSLVDLSGKPRINMVEAGGAAIRTDIDSNMIAKLKGMSSQELYSETARIRPEQGPPKLPAGSAFEGGVKPDLRIGQDMGRITNDGIRQGKIPPGEARALPQLPATGDSIRNPANLGDGKIPPPGASTSDGAVRGNQVAGSHPPEARGAITGGVVKPEGTFNQPPASGPAAIGNQAARPAGDATTSRAATPGTPGGTVETPGATRSAAGTAAGDAAAPRAGTVPGTRGDGGAQRPAGSALPGIPTEGTRAPATRVPATTAPGEAATRPAQPGQPAPQFGRPADTAARPAGTAPSGDAATGKPITPGTTGTDAGTRRNPFTTTPADSLGSRPNDATGIRGSQPPLRAGLDPVTAFEQSTQRIRQLAEGRQSAEGTRNNPFESALNGRVERIVGTESGAGRLMADAGKNGQIVRGDADIGRAGTIRNITNTTEAATAAGRRADGAQGNAAAGREFISFEPPAGKNISGRADQTGRAFEPQGKIDAANQGAAGIGRIPVSGSVRVDFQPGRDNGQVAVTGADGRVMGDVGRLPGARGFNQIGDIRGLNTTRSEIRAPRGETHRYITGLELALILSIAGIAKFRGDSRSAASRMEGRTWAITRQNGRPIIFVDGRQNPFQIQKSFGGARDASARSFRIMVSMAGDRAAKLSTRTMKTADIASKTTDAGKGQLNMTLLGRYHYLNYFGKNMPSMNYYSQFKSTSYTGGMGLAVVMAAAGMAKGPLASSMDARNPNSMGPADRIKLPSQNSLQVGRFNFDAAASNGPSIGRDSQKKEIDQDDPSLSTLDDYQDFLDRLDGFAKRKEDDEEDESVVMNRQIMYGTEHLLDLENPEDEDVVDLVDEDDTTNGASLSQVLRRPKWIIEAGQTLDGIAERLFSNADLGWLIADLNRALLRETYIDNKRIVELHSRQEIELPVWQDIQKFDQARKKGWNAENLITIVVERQIEREVVESVLSKVVGAEA